MLNNKHPNKYPNKISSQQLKSEFILVVCLRFERGFCTILKAAMLNGHARDNRTPLIGQLEVHQTSFYY